LDALNDRQKAAVAKTEGPLLVVAGAGSGKTRVLTHRLAYIIDQQKAKPWEILAVTFTNKAAGEMKERIAKLLGFDISRLWVSTFHSFCARLLRMEADLVGYPANFTILDQDDSKSLVKRCLKDIAVTGSQFTPDTVMRKISSAKNRLITAEQFAHEAKGYYDETISHVYTRYESKLRASAAFDFDDLLMMAVRLLAAHDAARQRWQKRFRYVMVDEYQDTNHAQYALLGHLVGPDKNICVVGDEDQSIYGWRGADISNILNFESDFPGAEVIKLEQNYRSTQTILSAASAVIKNNTSRKDKTLWTEHKGGDKICVALHESQNEEADWVINRILEGKRRVPLREMVILYRTNAQSRAFEDVLRRENTAYQIIGGVSFYQRKEIKDIVAYLKLISNLRDEASFVRIVNFPKRTLGDTSLEKLTTHARQNSLSLFDAAAAADAIDALSARAQGAFKKFADMILSFQKDARLFPIDRFIQKVIDEAGLTQALTEEDPITGETRRENLDEFVAAAQDFFHVNPDPTLDNFLADITLYTDLDSFQETEDKLTLMTLHNAKGLEFDLVFITGLEDGLFPLARSFDQPMEMEEERRLLYVGATRARKELVLTGARFRYRFGGEESVPSRFLAEIPGEYIEKIDRRSYRYEFGPTHVQPRRSTVSSNPDGVYYEYEDGEGMRPGCIVVHPKFGQGRVLKVEGFGEHMRIDVDFASVGPKKLIAKYANLKVVSS